MRASTGWAYRSTFSLAAVLTGAIALASPVLRAPAVQAQTVSGTSTTPAPDACGPAIKSAIEKLRAKIGEIGTRPDLPAALAEFGTFADQVKAEVQAVCAVAKEIAILEQANEIFVDSSIEQAKLRLQICRHKIAALSGFLRRYFGWIPPEATENELKIVNAVYGDVKNQRRFPRIRQTCNATPYIKEKCGAGSTYCRVTDSTSLALHTNACGFDPSPQGSKEICVSYTCGGSQRHGCWPSDTARIDLVCSFPPKLEGSPRTAAETAALEQEREFFAAEPCPIAVPPKS